MSLHPVRPKILGFISEDVSAWLVALLVLLAGGILTGLLAWATLNQFQQQTRQRFQLLANERYTRIEERFQDQEQRLDGLRRFFANSESVSRAEFDGYWQRAGMPVPKSWIAVDPLPRSCLNSRVSASAHSAVSPSGIATL